MVRFAQLLLVLGFIFPVISQANTGFRNASLYSCQNEAGDGFSLYDDSGLSELRVQTEQQEILYCQKTVDEAGSNGLIDLIASKKSKSRRKPVRDYCYPRGQICYGVYCQYMCCNSSYSHMLMWSTCR